MLSKLEYYSSSLHSSDDLREDAALRGALTRRFQSFDPDATIAAVRSGTLGVCFRLQQHSQFKFVKTHLPNASARARLKMEAEILTRLYGSVIVLETFNVETPSGPHCCIVMPELTKAQSAMTALDTSALVANYKQELMAFEPPSLPSDCDTRLLLMYGVGAVKKLLDEKFIDAATAREAEAALTQLRETIGHLPRVLCHGDLGPENILMQDKRPVAIDWEDAFWGIDGYDYLYWLTFLSNRRFLLSSAFGQTGLDRDVERSILVMIVLLKSYLSVLSGAYRNHAIPIGARLSEVLTLPLKVSA